MTAINSIYKNRISELSVVTAVLTMLKHKKTRQAGFRLIKIIGKEFFTPQFFSRLKIRKKEVIHIDHELDDKIPFNPSYIKTYLNFVHLWLKSLLFLYWEFGAAAIPEIALFIDDLGSLYHNAFHVYDKLQSTTARPKNSGGVHFYFIRAVDPHLHCFPSLHVMIAGYTYLKISRILDSFERNNDVYAAEKDYLFSQTVAIIDSVLFVKQHSVNCIPAGLFFLQSMVKDFPEKFTERIIQKLLNTPEIPVDARERINTHIITVYENFTEMSEQMNPVNILLNFLRNYSGTKR